jgi:hypothetical protein
MSNEPQHLVGGVRSTLAHSDAIGCGSESQPWSVEALAGQRIAVSLINLSSYGNVKTLVDVLLKVL